MEKIELLDPATVFVEVGNGLRLHTLQWSAQWPSQGSGHKHAFVLLHGLSSNAYTWRGVASRLAQAGHAVIAVDQRGHGLSDKPAGGYDFSTVSADLASLLERLDIERPIIAGQSWGGNVVLEFGARYPGSAHGLAFVDGGFLDLQGRSQNGVDTSWEAVSLRLRPHDMDGAAKAYLENRIQTNNSTWPEWGIDATLRNFEWLPDGTIRRWLPIEKHMLIVRALWEQRPPQLYARLQEPVLICPADTGDQDWLAVKKRQVAAAEQGIANVDVHWFHDTHHDIHIQRPTALADLMLASLEMGVWAAH